MSDSTTRREALRTIGSALTTSTVGAAALAATAAAVHVSEIPEHVSIEFDRGFLEQYRPHYAMSSDAEDLHRATYAWVARSPEYDRDVAVYFNAFRGQRGVSQYDSHKGDHEPTYCWINSDTGDLEAVSASVYHWLEGHADASAVPVADETHPVLKVLDPWHHHTAGEVGAGSTTSLESLGTRDGLEDPDVTTEFEAWLANGLEEDLGVGTVTTPWRMRARSHWWQKNVGSVSTTALLLQAERLAGFRVAGDLKA